jgi:hypothetical protein
MFQMHVGFSRNSATVLTHRNGPPKNTRAMMQLGMLFGFGYLGFLAVWFWITRFRSKVGRPLRL